MRFIGLLAASAISVANAGTSGSCLPQIPAVLNEATEGVSDTGESLQDQLSQLPSADPTLTPGASVTKTRLLTDGSVSQVVVSLSSNGVTYTESWSLASRSSPSVFVMYQSGTAVPTVAGTVMTVSGTFNTDWDALHSVDPTLSNFAGQMNGTYSSEKDTSRPAKQQKKLFRTITFTNFLASPTDPDGPQNGTLTSLNESGVGSSLAVTDALILQCPANPALLTAGTMLVRRSYLASDGSNHSRTDTQATGGQIPAGDKIEGVRCQSGSGGSATSYLMTKVEDGSGNTVQGSASVSPPTAANPCDAVFGAVPSLTNNATDYDFTQSPTFPNEW